MPKGEYCVRWKLQPASAGRRRRRGSRQRRGVGEPESRRAPRDGALSGNRLQAASAQLQREADQLRQEARTEGLAERLGPLDSTASPLMIGDASAVANTH